MRAYRCFYAATAGAVALAALGVLALGVAAAVLGADGRAEWAGAMGAAAAACLAFTGLMRLHANQVLVRAARWPALCQAERMPRTVAELTSVVRKLNERHGEPPEIVGGAWGFFLYRRVVRRNCVFTHRFRGIMKRSRRGGADGPYMASRWAAGTTIREMLDHYRKQVSAEHPNGLTVSTHPTMEYITLGAWFVTASHGNGGDLASGSAKVMKGAEVLHMRSGIRNPVNYAQLRAIFDDDNESREHVVVSVDVDLDALVDNGWVQKRAIELSDPKQCGKWLAPGAHLRVCFQGASRSSALGLRWTDVYNKDETHVDPHCCSDFCAFVQVDTCSIYCGCREKLASFQGRSLYLDGNRWLPPVTYFMSLLPVLTGHLNAEIYFRLERALDGPALYDLTQRLIEVHKRHGGRSELRYGAPGPTTPVFLDMVMVGKDGFEPILKMLRKTFLSVRSVARHLGKFPVEVEKHGFLLAKVGEICGTAPPPLMRLPLPRLPEA